MTKNFMQESFGEFDCDGLRPVLRTHTSQGVEVLHKTNHQHIAYHMGEVEYNRRMAGERARIKAENERLFT